MLRYMETLAKHKNIPLEKALFDFVGKSMNKGSQGLTSSTKVKRVRPLLLGSEMVEKVMKYLHTIRKKGGIVNTVVAIAIAQALIVISEDKNLKVPDLEKTSWTKSLFHRMGFVK